MDGTSNRRVVPTDNQKCEIDKMGKMYEGRPPARGRLGRLLRLSTCSTEL